MTHSATSDDLDYSVDVAIDHEQLRAALRHRAKPSEPAEYAFYLMRAGEALQRTAYSREPRVVFDLPTSGRYTVKAFARTKTKKVSRSSKVVLFSNPEPTPMPALPDLPYTRLSYPHQDIAAVIIDEHRNPEMTQTLVSQAADLGMQLTSTAAESAFVIHSGDAIKQDSLHLFSGTGRTADRLIHGSSDLADIDVSAIEESVGEFTLFSSTQDGFAIRADYFGVGKVYYYASRGVSIATNRYHLLISTLSRLGVPLEPNRRQLRASLQALNQMFGQNFSREMGIEGCFCLPAGSRLQLSMGDAELFPSDLSKVLSEPTNQLPDEKTYAKLIREAATEIVDNLRIAIAHERFDRIRVDVTGGLDARMVASALSQVKDRSKVSINTTNTTSSPLDLPISLRLTRELSVPYDSGPQVSTEVDSELSLLQMTSINLAGYFGLRAETRRTSLPGALRVNGFFGETCARPYFSRLFFGMSILALHPSDFSTSYVRAIPQRALPLSSTTDLESCFREEFDRLPGGSSASKFEAFYLFHRNGHHCSDRWASKVTSASWGPLQSKALFNLKWITLDTYRDIRIQTDATELLSERMAVLPVGSDRDNSDRRSLSAKYPETPDNFFSELGVTRADEDRFKSALESRKANTRTVRPGNAASIRASNRDRDRRELMWVLSGIAELSETHKILSPSEAEALTSFARSRHEASGEKTGPGTAVLLNKILSAVYQCRIASAVHTQA